VHGKSRLVEALIPPARRLFDEFAVLDKDGRVHRSPSRSACDDGSSRRVQPPSPRPWITPLPIGLVPDREPYRWHRARASARRARAVANTVRATRASARARRAGARWRHARCVPRGEPAAAMRSSRRSTLTPRASTAASFVGVNVRSLVMRAHRTA
jgi:hypothetical protein